VNTALGAGRGIPAYAGMTVWGTGMTVWGRDMAVWGMAYGVMWDGNGGIGDGNVRIGPRPVPPTPHAIRATPPRHSRVGGNLDAHSTNHSANATSDLAGTRVFP